MRYLRVERGIGRIVFVAASAAMMAMPQARAQEGIASTTAASSMSSSMSGMGGSSITPGGATQGMGGPGGTQTTTTTTVVRHTQAFRTGRSSGADFLNELMAAPQPRAIPSRRPRSPRAAAAYARRVSRMTASERSRLVQSKYHKPPVGWLAYYLPQDRYKVTSSNWRYVSIEDDTRDYPVRYYYRPSSPQMLNVLRNSPRGLPRYNRVIGFHTWQDAMIAGYRPDPVSRPEPGAQVAQLARVARGPQLERYVEFLYAGQISPQSFSASYSYLRQVEQAVSRRPDTRPLVGQTVRQALAAVMGEGEPPRSVGGSPRTATAVAQVPATSGPPPGTSGPPSGTNAPGANPGANPSSQTTSESSGGDKRTEDFEKFSNRAGNLAAKR